MNTSSPNEAVNALVALRDLQRAVKMSRTLSIFFALLFGVSIGVAIATPSPDEVSTVVFMMSMAFMGFFSGLCFLASRNYQQVFDFIKEQELNRFN